MTNQHRFEKQAPKITPDQIKYPFGQTPKTNKRIQEIEEEDN
jgi:hypothetical protein